MFREFFASLSSSSRDFLQEQGQQHREGAIRAISTAEVVVIIFIVFIIIIIINNNNIIIITIIIRVVFINQALFLYLHETSNPKPQGLNKP